MPFLVGMDEVGYGPSLGPLVVCAVGFEVPAPGFDLRRVLGDAGGPVLDSKRLFTQARGIAAIEPTALAYLGRLWPVRNLTHAALWSRISPDPRRAPWYGDIALPCASPPRPFEPPSGVRMAGAWARILDAADFNARVGTNKADLLFECAVDLMERVLDVCPGRVEFFVGRHGGRRYYLRPLVKHFGTARVREERARVSTYEIARGTVSFLTDGEDARFEIALASIVGKYLRELSMRLFNDYWRARIAGLTATAGYGTDARRFWREIEPHLAVCRLTPDDVLRRR